MGNIKTLKPFQSGHDSRRNTNGRPKGSRNVRTVLMEILKEKVMVNGKKITLSELIVLQVATKAMKGNLQAAQIVMDRVDGKPIDHDKEKREHGYVVVTEEEERRVEELFREKSKPNIVPESRPDGGTSIT